MKRLCYNKNMHRAKCINCMEDFPMIDEKKVKLMTKAAIFEKKERRKAMEIMCYRRQDYIVLHVILSWICATIMAGFAVGLVLIYMMSRGVHILYQLSYVKTVVIIGIVLFFMFSLIYCFLAYWHYVECYDDAEKKFKEYEEILKQLNEFYEE